MNHEELIQIFDLDASLGMHQNWIWLEGPKIVLGPSKIHGTGVFTRTRGKQTLLAVTRQGQGTQISRFMNHSDSPNMRLLWYRPGRLKFPEGTVYYTGQAEWGEELTIDYEEVLNAFSRQRNENG